MAGVAPPRRWAAALGLTGIVAAACGVSLIWVFAVPIYQSPDEPAHLDYALAIYAHGRPFLAQHTSFDRLPETAHPYTDYLENRTRAFEISFSPGAKVEPGYGTAEYFAALDRDVPPANGVTGPNQLAAVYPFGYYTVLAGWIGLVRQFSDSLTVTFFAARIFSVNLLAVTLVASYGTIRLLGFSIQFALLLTAGIGLFPLTSFVSSYVQPDNLSWALVSASYYCALRGRRNRWPVRDLIPLGLVLGGLVVTKLQFFVCVTGPILALLAADLVYGWASWRRCLTSATVVLAPPILLGSIYLWTVNGTENYFGSAARNNAGKSVQLFLRAMRDFFYGASHRSFWGVFGWGDTHLVVGNYQTTFALHVLLHLFSAVTLILTIVGLTRTARRLIALARRERIGSAIRLALGNPVVNSLFVFTTIITAIFVHTENRFAAQGRNWLPMMLPIFLVGIVYAPRALSRPATRRAYSGVALAGLLIYDAVGGYYALKCVHERYYLPFTSLPTQCASLSTEPAQTHLAVRSGDGWVMSGPDAFLQYAVGPEEFVHGVRLEFRVINEFRGRCTFRVTWRTGEESAESPPRSAHFFLNEREGIRGLTAWTNDSVRDFRIYPDIRPCRIEIENVTVLH